MRWTVIYDGFNVEKHPLQEALTTLGNGYFATRGALEMVKNKHPGKQEHDYAEEVYRKWNYPGTYLAGGYNRLKSKVQDKNIENEDLVNWPNWLYLTCQINDGRWFDPEQDELLDYQTKLHLKGGILERNIRFRDDKGRITRLSTRRIVSMHDYHVAAIKWEVTPENWSGTIRFRSGIDGAIINNNVERYSDLNQNHIEVISTGRSGSNGLYLVSRSKQSRIEVAQAIRTSFYRDNIEVKVSPVGADNEQADSISIQDYAIDCSQGEAIEVEKVCSLYTSRDVAISNPLLEALQKIERSGRYDELEKSHIQAWDHIWQFNDIELVTSESLDQLVLRLHIFHLYQTVSYNSIDYDIGIPARGWHGEAYRGHIFWDELYIMPYINLHHPQLSRSLLMYRYRRLPEARITAKEAGFRGAVFPWQSGSNGREETQKVHLNPKSGRWLPDVSHLQYHINAAIPYNVWHYYQSTGDMDFLLSHGAELILSAALFWSGIASYNKQSDRYEINGVMGPDEYHTHYPWQETPGLNNNAYTNIMAVWVIQRALDLLGLFDPDCCKNLEATVGFTSEDMVTWKDITKKMYVPLREDKVIMQFDGYDELEELDWDHYHEKYGYALRLDRILESEGDSCNKYKASKQADVLMLFYLFSSEELSELFKRIGYEFDPESIPDNIEYYRKRTAHGSTLSQVIHAWVYARSHRQESWNRFRQALMSDFNDVQGGTTHEGIHLGAMAGTLDLIQRCYTGMEIRDDVLWFKPKLPSEIKSLRFQIRYRSHWIKLDINQQRMRIEFDKGWAEPVTIGVRGEKHHFETNDKKEFKLKA
jgi:trehalose/maltose hydrolase-like predicted phosphorylase